VHVCVCVCDACEGPAYVSSLGDLEVDGGRWLPVLPALQVVVETQLRRRWQLRQFLLSVERCPGVPLKTPAHTHENTLWFLIDVSTAACTIPDAVNIR